MRIYCFDTLISIAMVYVTILSKPNKLETNDNHCNVNKYRELPYLYDILGQVVILMR